MFDEEFFRRLFDLNKPTPIVIRIPSDSDIDKIKDTSIEELAYRRLKSIANAKINTVNWNVAIKCLSEDVCLISKLIRDKDIKHPEEIKEFTENVIAIMDVWDKQYREAFDIIKEFRDSYKAPKSINDMDIDELREYIRKHNIK